MRLTKINYKKSNEVMGVIYRRFCLGLASIFELFVVSYRSMASKKY